MGLKEFLANYWPFRMTPEQQLKKLVQQLDTALEDLKIKMAESIAQTSALQKKIDQIDKTERQNNAQHAAISESLRTEQQLTETLRGVYAELKDKKSSIELSCQQIVLRQRKVSANNLMTSIYKDFGSNLQLNNYLEKLNRESFKIEFTAENNLRVESLLKKIDQ